MPTDESSWRRLSACFNKFLDVFADKIGFEVQSVSYFSFPQRCHVVGVRDDPNPEALFLHSRHSQADSIDSDRTLGDDISHHVGRSSDIQDVILPVAFPARYGSYSIDMAG